MVGYLKQNNNAKKRQNQKYTLEGNHEKMDNNKKEESESLWETFLDMGIKKALGLVWLIYTIVYIIAMFMVYWFSKNPK
jgi:hypothetical protein